MQLLTPVTLVLLAGSTLTMPTTNDTSIHEKRGHHGWVGSGFTDLNCEGQPVGDRPEVHYFDCIKFKPSAYGADKFIAINYGTSVYRFHELAFYSDDGCKNLADGPLPKVDQPGDNGTGCVTTAEIGSVIGSVAISKS